MVLRHEFHKNGGRITFQVAVLSCDDRGHIRFHLFFWGSQSLKHRFETSDLKTLVESVEYRSLHDFWLNSSFPLVFPRLPLQIFISPISFCEPQLGAPWATCGAGDQCIDCGAPEHFVHQLGDVADGALIVMP